MSEHSEVIVTSHGIGKDSSICLLDPISGTILRSFKRERRIGANCLSFVGNDYIVFAEEGEPFIYSAKVNGESVNSIKVTRVNVLAVSPNSHYCVFGAGASIKVLNLQSGEITEVASRHFHEVICIKFTDDGSCFVTAGLDGIINVWNLAYILSSKVHLSMKSAISDLRMPMHVFTSHSLPITDLHVGHGGMQAFIASVSGDQTCKIHCLSDGNLILSLVFKCGLSAVTMSVCESELFVGTVSGNIYKCNVSRMPRTRDYHMNEDDLSFVYQGHDQPISCLSSSLDGLRLLSASKDGRIILWDIKSTQSVKVLSHAHPVFNAYFVICPKNTFLESFEPSSIVTGSSGEKGLHLFYRKSGFHSYINVSRTQLRHFGDPVLQKEPKEDLGMVPGGDVNEFSTLKTINKELFEFALNHLLKKVEKREEVEKEEKKWKQEMQKELAMSKMRRRKRLEERRGRQGFKRENK